ncbi:ABC transporter substrate-binding protein [Ostreibacterium oceani]|uniref:ABC transporter substrate-binding protein n=1 Tax=Ostreibacterium oceani TaxID=2654998 RepID=A0A6N7EUZ1_9GAMM|nr:ABC transporter substrate-binding protein [Ostreibacterium oceani]MPV86381.1 ABC transporter substrate-binding protein [Ostreibacterium oceani]
MKTQLFAALVTSLLTVQAFAYPKTIQSCDREVTFNAAPARAASNDVNLTEMMLTLGLADRMVGYTGISGWKTLDESLREGIGELPELSPKYPTREVLIGADLDFWFAGWNYGMKVGGEVTPATLAPFGIKVYELTESCVFVSSKNKASIDDMYNDILNLGHIFDVQDKAHALVAGWKQDIIHMRQQIDPDAKGLRVFVYDSGEESPFTAARYAIPTALIELAGGHNIMDDVEASWTRVAWEAVVERNPEVIVIVNYGEVTAAQKIEFLKSQPALATIDAVKHNRFVVLDYIEATPGPRNIQAIQTLINTFYPL